MKECTVLVLTDSLGGGKAALDAVADDRLNFAGAGTGELLELPAGADAAVADGDGPGRKQILAERDLVAAVMIVFLAVGFESQREQIVHWSFLSRSGLAEVLVERFAADAEFAGEGTLVFFSGDHPLAKLSRSLG